MTLLQQLSQPIKKHMQNKAPSTVPKQSLASERVISKRVKSAFWVMVEKEFSDHIRSWRFTILLAIITLACIGSIYGAITAIKEGALADTTNFLFLSMFTVSDGTIPPFIQFVAFLGPLMGVALGFDAVNAERNKGTLSRIISQPIFRDDFLKAKFTASLLLISVVMFSLGFLVMGLGLIFIGYPPTSEQLVRVIGFILTSIVYIGFWLNLSILCSVRFKQAATSALSTISIWIFFTIFFNIILNLISGIITPEQANSSSAMMNYYQQMNIISRFSPAELFSDITSILLMPNIRSLGVLTIEQVTLAIESPLSIGQSLLLVWPQLTALLALTFIIFAISFYLFMRQEIRSRS